MMTVDELRQQIAALPPVTGSSFWGTKRLELRQRIANDDPTQFLRWPTITSTMYVGDAPFVETERREIPEQYYPFLQEPAWGNPSSGNANLTHQMYHLSQWIRCSGQAIDRLDSIVEIGGGYGAMALLCQRLGFQGRYYIDDLPEFALLQQWYLERVLDEKMVSWSDSPKRCDLLLAIHSLSEMAIEERRIPNASSCLFVYHCEHDGIDNQAYFDALIASEPHCRWWNWTTEHLLNQRYLIGVKP